MMRKRPQRGTRHADVLAAALSNLDALYTHARLVLGGRDDAEAAVSECIDWAKDGQILWPDQAAARLHVLTILTRVCRTRAQRRAPSTATAHSAAPEPLRPLLQALNEPCREAILLRELHCLSYQEIAQVSGASPDEVRSRLAFARLRLSR